MSTLLAISADELAALRAAAAERDALHQQATNLQGELRLLTVERDLLREQLKAFQRRLFDAKSEARGSEQRDLFLNEAEMLCGAGTAEPAQESEPNTVTVLSHSRKKGGRKPLDPALPREIVRHEL